MQGPGGLLQDVAQNTTQAEEGGRDVDQGIYPAMTSQRTKLRRLASPQGRQLPKLRRQGQEVREVTDNLL